MLLSVIIGIVIIGSGNGLAPIRCQAIIWTNDDMTYQSDINEEILEEVSIKDQNTFIKKFWVMSYNCKGISFHQTLRCLFKSLSRLTKKQLPKFYSTVPLCWISTSYRGIPHTKGQ